MKYLFIPVLFLMASVASACDLNPLFTDHMELQRELRYAFKDFPLSNLYTSGLPAGPFRADYRPNYEVKN